MAVAELIVSRRVLLGATLAIPVACVASPRNDGAALSPGQRDGGPIMGSSQTQRRQLGSGSSPEHGQGQRNDNQSPTVTKYDRALATFRRAEAALAAAAHEPDEERYGDLVVAFNRALERLLRAPAPDLPALALKIHLTVDHQAWELPAAEPCLAALARDAARLARRP